MRSHASGGSHGTTCALVAVVSLAGNSPARAADSFEIQVFHAEELNAPKQLSLELHSNYVPIGPGTGRPLGDAGLYENLEPVIGITRWWEIGMHLQGAARPGGVDWGGIRLRTQFHFPLHESRLPLHLGLNIEGAYVPPQFDAARWVAELRPIFELRLGRWDIDFNPVFTFPLTGGRAGVPRFEPALALRYDFEEGVGVSIEYYAAIGQLTAVLPVARQGQYLFATVDVGWSRWSLHLGVGRGLTEGSNPIVVTSILVRRFN